MKKRYILRRVLGKTASQNLLARRPVENPVLRIVLMAHADASYTGFLFKPEFIRAGTQRQLPEKLAFLRKSLLVATASVFLLAFVDFLIWVDEMSTFKTVLLVIATIPSAIAFALNYEVVRRNEVVPGANDNLTGCGALLVLAERLKTQVPANVEIVYAVTGAEEVGLAGAVAMRNKMSSLWSRTNTIPIAVDTLSGGDLVLYQDGEVMPLHMPRWLANVAQRAAHNTEGLGSIATFDIPVGATDAAAFAYDGYDALAVGCVDPLVGAPKNYHLPSDTLENVDFDQVILAIDFVEKLVLELVSERLGKQKLPKA
jgi:hypothetical protein